MTPRLIMPSISHPANRGLFWAAFLAAVPGGTGGTHPTLSVPLIGLDAHHWPSNKLVVRPDGSGTIRRAAPLAILWLCRYSTLMPPRIGATIFKLILASLGVGLLLSFLNVDPRKLVYNFGDTVRAIFDQGVDLVQWATPYVMLGAIVVVPIWLVTMLARYARERQKK